MGLIGINSVGISSSCMIQIIHPTCLIEEPNQISQYTVMQIRKANQKEIYNSEPNRPNTTVRNNHFECIIIQS
jgi:hypothetical protein